MVFSVVTPTSVTRQVTFLLWSQGFGVKESTEERRLRVFKESRALPTHEKMRGLPLSQDPGRLQVSCVGRPDSRGLRMRMSGFCVRPEEERRRCLGPWAAMRIQNGTHATGPELTPGPVSLLTPWAQGLD